MAFEKTKPEGDAKPKETKPKDGQQAKAKKPEAKPKADSKPKDSTSSKPKRKPGPPTARRKLENQLEEIVVGTGMALITVGQVHDGVVLVSRGEGLVKAWVDVSEHNEAVARVLNKLVEGGVWSGVIISTASVVIPIAQNHIRPIEHLPLPFQLSEKDMEGLPEEIQLLVAMKQAQEEERAAARAGAAGPMDTGGMPHGPQASGATAHEPERE